MELWHNNNNNNGTLDVIHMNYMGFIIFISYRISYIKNYNSVRIGESAIDEIKFCSMSLRIIKLNGFLNIDRFSTLT